MILNKIMNSKNIKKGFTLLELLIVISILAVLGAIVIFLLNPAETLKKARDSQRISDLSTIKTAIGIYMTSVSSPQFDGISGTKNDKCLGGAGIITAYTSFVGTATTTPTSDYSPTFTVVTNSTTASSSLVDGTGWIPVNLTSLTGGSPISNMPVDPINDNTDLIYRYACRKSPLGFEVDSTLESTAFTVDDDKGAKDGGNNSARFEAGTDLKILKI